MNTHMKKPAAIPLMRRVFLGVLALAFANAGIAQSAWKADKPIKIVVPFTAGVADVMARLVAQGMQERLGQPVIVENKPGASGAIGSDYVFNAPPDGSVLLVASADSQMINPYLNKVRFDTPKFVPIGGLARTSFVLMGRPDLPATDLAELRKLMVKQSLTYSSAGAGSSLHVVGSIFGTAAKADSFVHVPYQGSAQALQAVMAGQVDLVMLPAAMAAPYISKLKIYGVTADNRNEYFGSVPTFSEQGMPLVAETWSGLVAPPGTPPAIAAAISRALFETMATPAVQTRLKEMGVNTLSMNAADFARYYNDEYKRWGAFIRSANVKIN